MSLAELIEDINDFGNLWKMANIESSLTGLPFLVHLQQGWLRHSPRIKLQLSPGRPNRKNTVSISIHNPDLVKGRSALISGFVNSFLHSKVKQFINLNRDALLLHARSDITDDELRRRLIRC